MRTQPTKLSNTPAATAEPITPATFRAHGASAGSSAGWLPGRPCSIPRRHWHRRHPSRTDQRVDLVAAEQVHQFGHQHPDAVPAQNAIMPRLRIPSVFNCRNDPPRASSQPSAPRKMVTILISALRGIRQTLDHTRFTQQVAKGKHPDQRRSVRQQQANQQTQHDREDDLRPAPPGRSCCMTMERSSLVVSARMIGG